MTAAGVEVEGEGGVAGVDVEGEGGVVAGTGGDEVGGEGFGEVVGEFG